jgi:hypothetical protein
VLHWLAGLPWTAARTARMEARMSLGYIVGLFEVANVAEELRNFIQRLTGFYTCVRCLPLKPDTQCEHGREDNTS